MSVLMHFRQADLHAGEFEESIWITLCINCLSFKVLMLLSSSRMFLKAEAIKARVS